MGGIFRIFSIIMPSTNRDNFFLYNSDAFSFLCVIIWLRFLILCWIGMVRVGTPILFLVLKKTFTLSPFSMMLAAELLYGLFYIEECSFYIRLLEIFFLSWTDVEFCQKLLCIYWYGYVIFIFHSVDVMYYISVCLEPSLHPRDESHLIVVHDPFNLMLNSIF